jgi:hypothetical protein
MNADFLFNYLAEGGGGHISCVEVVGEILFRKSRMMRRKYPAPTVMVLAVMSM